MKKSFIYLAMIASLTFIGLKSANAQITLETVTIKGNSTKAMVSEKVANSFSHHFKDATQPQWLQINKNFVVDFILNDRKNKAVFTPNGTLVYDLSYGTEKDIPDDVRKQIQNDYKDYDITYAIKVNTGQNTAWVVNLESDKKILVISATDGELNVIKTLNRS